MVIFTLLDDKVADFDRLAEQTAEQVRIGEPDTFVYVIHSVPGAPLQRIFYEIYRNRAAFEAHEDKPFTQRFTTERRSYVLATNVIELRLKYAKVAPLPQPQARPSTPPGGPGAHGPQSGHGSPGGQPPGSRGGSQPAGGPGGSRGGQPAGTRQQRPPGPVPTPPGPVPASPGQVPTPPGSVPTPPRQWQGNASWPVRTQRS